ncbi:DUF2252 domain-containing protein [Geodermatophilus sp. SYSU D00684]
MTDTVLTPPAAAGFWASAAESSAAPPHRTPRERAQLGKAARRTLPLDEHEGLPRDPVDVVGLLQAEDRARVPELLPIRYERMLASPFAFYRGSAVVMATDLARGPGSGLRTQLCGDAHLSNFGVYATPERRLVFDVNDFDETLAGPFGWDVKRLAASLALAGRANGHDARARRQVLRAAVGRYRTAMREFARMGNLAVWYASLDVDRVLADLTPRLKAADRRRTAKAVRRARTRDNVDALHRLTRSDGGPPRFVDDPPLLVRLSDLLPDVTAAALEASLREILASYRSTLQEDRRHLLDEFRLVDVARKVVGVGSVGTRAFVLLLTGRDDTDPLVLQVKEAGESVLETHCGVSPWPTAGQRVVHGQRVIQAASDIFLGWQRARDIDGQVRDYYVRQLRDGKASADVEDMSPRRLAVYGQMCAWTLARAHARSGDRIAIAAYLGKSDAFDQAVAALAEGYADRTESQYLQLRDAVTRGVVVASQTG